MQFTTNEIEGVNSQRDSVVSGQRTQKIIEKRGISFLIPCLMNAMVYEVIIMITEFRVQFITKGIGVELSWDM